MNVLRKSCRFTVLAALLLLPTACVQPHSAAPHLTPTPKVYESPTDEIQNIAALTLVVKDDPTYAHWLGYFGGSVGIEGDILVVGEPEWGSTTSATGAAYVFRRSLQGDWQMETSLLASDRDDGIQFNQNFGEVIAIQGGLIAVGAPGADDPQMGDNTGAVYIYEYDGQAWVETGKLVSSQASPGARLGSDLALDGNLIAVSGAPETGLVAIFQRQGSEWREQAQVPVPTTPDGEPGYVKVDLFGETLVISTVSMGLLEEPEWDVSVLRRTGAISLYERRGEKWEQTFQTGPLEASLYRMYDGPFGIPVALGGEDRQASWLAVGKPGFPKSGRENGSVLVYERGTGGWELQTELMLAPGEPASGALPAIWFNRENPEDLNVAFFGADVELEGSRLAVVSTFANTVSIFERQETGWVYRFRLVPESNDDFQRRTVAMSGSDLLLGSPGELGGGSAFLFFLPP
jgi:hypothetical protein